MALTAEDRLDILDIHARFCQAIDAGDAAAWCALFTSDGTIALASGEWSGQAKLADFVATNGAIGVHLVTNVVIEESAEGATSVCNVLFSRRPADGGPPAISFLGIYRDWFAREDGRWKLQRRDITPANVASPTH